MMIGSRPVTRSRLVLMAATTVVVLGLLVGLGAFWLSPARAAVGPLPAEALLLPQDARFVIALDVRRFTASPFYARYAQQAGMTPEALRQLQQKTGLDPARDIEQIVIAGGGPSSRVTDTLALALGRFDLRKVRQALQVKGEGRDYTHEGGTIYAFKGEGQAGTALAFLGDRALVFGGKERVEAAVASRTRGEAPLRSNQAIVGLIERVRPGSTFWMVGDQSLLAGLPSSISAPGGTGATMNLPALRSLTVTGDLDPQLSLSLTGDTADEQAAGKLADVVRGLMALVTLQAAQKPELQQLASAVTVATDANRVLVSARIPYALLDALQSSLRPPGSPPAGPPANALPPATAPRS